MIFLCHRSVDLDTALRLKASLEEGGDQVWLDALEIRIGDLIVQRLEEGLAAAAYLILCVSGAGTSPWMDQEWMSTLTRQLNGADVRVLPAVLPGGSLPAILAGIRFADLASDWDRGVAELRAAVKKPSKAPPG